MEFYLKLRELNCPRKVKRKKVTTVLKLVHREFPIVVSFAARLDKQISNK